MSDYSIFTFRVRVRRPSGQTRRSDLPTLCWTGAIISEDKIRQSGRLRTMVQITGVPRPRFGGEITTHCLGSTWKIWSRNVIRTWAYTFPPTVWGLCERCTCGRGSISMRQSSPPNIAPQRALTGRKPEDQGAGTRAGCFWLTPAMRPMY